MKYQQEHEHDCTICYYYSLNRTLTNKLFTKIKWSHHHFHAIYMSSLPIYLIRAFSNAQCNSVNEQFMDFKNDVEKRFYALS